MSTEKQSFGQFLKSYFDLSREKENEYETIESLKSDVDFKGTKMWILICAIFIASLGLNMNSTAVIIGAMLISPLMGPIIGLGLGLGITDFELVNRSLRNFAMATVISILTSTLYFLLSPISQAQTEILARTQPTIWDVLIAFFGGLAGIIAGASKSKGNVIPGVAIATALMPPLCVSGYGLGTGQMNIFIGAFYLYIINAVFIGLATFITVRVLKFPHKSFVDKVREKRLNNLVVFIVLCTAVPSVILGYKLIQRTYLEEQQRKFIKNEFMFDDTYILGHEAVYNKDGNKLYVSLLGEDLTQHDIERLQAKMPAYGIDNTTLIIRQGYGKTNLEDFRHSILSDVKKDNSSLIRYQQFRIDSLERVIVNTHHLSEEAVTISKDIYGLFPEIKFANFGKIYRIKTDSIAPDTIIKVSLTTEKKLDDKTIERIENWLKVRLPNAEVQFDEE